MTIPIATTTITVTRVEAGDTVDPYDGPSDQPAPTTVATSVRAAIGPPTATTGLTGGRRVEYEARLVADPCNIAPGDSVVDAGGNEWTLVWARRVTAFGTDHMLGSLRTTTGTT